MSWSCRWLVQLCVGRKAIDHNAGNQAQVLDHAISRAYREVTIDRWYAAPVPAWQTHRRYFAATPEAPVAGMFSFFPCPSLVGGQGFARPSITLPGFVTPSQTQKYKKTVVGDAKAVEAWRHVVAQVLGAGLGLGVRADMPRAEVADAPPKVSALRC